jgi:(R)-amidase
VLAELKNEDAVLGVTADRALLTQSREHYSYLHDARVALNLADENDAQGRRSLKIRAR